MESNKIIAIEHVHNETKNSTLINWCLGNTCNYECSYCPETLHSGSVRWVDYQLALNFCTKIIQHYKALGNKIEFLFTGGEPTLYPGFSKLLIELKTNNCEIGVITNGSRTMKWWENNIHLFDKIVLTYHSEFADRNHISELVKFIKDKVDLHINFTMLPNQFDSCLETAKALHEQNSNVSITLKPLLKEFGDELYEYDEAQLKTLNTVRFSSTKKSIAKRGLMKKVLDSREEVKCKAIDFILKKENHWKDWICYIGLELLYIDYKGDVYRGTCKQGNKIVNIHLSQDFSFPEQPIVCKKETCHCLTDIMTSKHLAL